MPKISLIQLIRPEQWTKNLFVFLPLFFSGKLLDISLLLQCVVAFFAFSFAASSIYCFNDICDVEADRQHPKKCNRPIASGAVSIRTAYVVMIVCLVLSTAMLLLFGETEKILVMVWMALYYVINLAYCVKLKRFAIVDVTVVSIGFILRILVGGTITDVRLSEWIVIMTFLLALFLAFAKRRDDVVLYENTGIAPRKNTNCYNLEFLNHIMTVVSTVTIIAYIMYTLSPDVIERFQSRYIYVTSIFVLAGIIRYLQVTIVELKSGSPTAILLKDRFIQLCVLCWLVSFLIIIYL